MRSKTVIPLIAYVEWSTGRMNAVALYNNSNKYTNIVDFYITFQRFLSGSKLVNLLHKKYA